MDIHQFISAEALTITLDNALEIALKNNTQIKQYESDAKIAEAQYSQTVGDFWIPDIALNAGANYIDSTTIEGSIIDSPGNISATGFPPQITIETNKITNAFFDNYSVTLGVSKPLFSGFRLWNSMELKKMNLEMVKLRLKDKQNEVEAAVKLLFYNLFLLKENVRLTEELVSHFQERYNEILSNFKGGYISEYDKIKAEVQYKTYIPKLLKLNNAESIAMNALCEQLSFDNAGDVEFIGNFFNITNTLETDIPYNAALSKALSNNLTFKTIEYSIDMAKLNKKIVEGSRLPVVSAFFNYKYDLKKENYMDNDRKWLPGWNTGVQLTMPIDDWIPISKTENSIKEAQDNIEKLEWLKKQTTDTITFQVKNLLEQLSNGNIIIESQRDIKNQAQLGFELSKKRYKSGASPSIEVNDMEASYYQANTAFLQVIYEEYTNIIVLQKIINE